MNIEGKHSHSYGYKNGCRCKGCREYNRDYWYRRSIQLMHDKRARAVKEFDKFMGASKI